MAVAPAADRQVYRCSGGMRPISFLWGACMSILAGVLISAVMVGCRMIGFYLLLVPLIAGGIAGWLGMLVVQRSHCRNVFLAGVLGFLIGAVAYLGHYHLDLLQLIGIDNWHRVDILPSYIWKRWEVDTVGRVGRGNNAPAWFPMNATISVGEFAIMGGLGAIIAIGAAGKPYAEGAQCWMSSLGVVVPSGIGTSVAEALNQRSEAALIAALNKEPSDPEAYCQLDYWMCPRERDPDGDEPILMSITEHGPPDKEGKRKETSVAKLWVLEPAEFLVMVKQVPNLQTMLQLTKWMHAPDPSVDNA